MSPYSLWIILSSWLICTGWLLSYFKELNAVGYLLSLVLFISLLGVAFPRYLANSRRHRLFNCRKIRRRFLRPLPLVYLTILVAALIGGAAYPPTNYDALCYRLPRVLHWWSASQWHWIGGANDRMDFSATGFEWLMAPFLILLKTDRFLFLINLISYALLPGLIYSSFVGLGISRRVAWSWMWILPAAYCFAIQAGSIGNDSFAVVYFLSAIVFALRAKERNSWGDAILAILATALLTGAKATNLPLLLPLALVITPMLRVLTKQPILTLAILIVAIIISFLPIAFFTLIHTGDWSGDPLNQHKIKLKDPIAGIMGNTLQIGVGAIAPPIFPIVQIWNAKTSQWMQQEPLRSVHNHYPRLDLGIGELPIEEGAGLGLGITLLLLIALCAIIFCEDWRVGSRMALIFGLMCWVALGAYMGKMGSESAARLVAAYYPGLILPFLAFRVQHRLVSTHYWKIAAVCCQLAVIPALLLSPARPLIPMVSLTEWLQQKHLLGSLTERIHKVYSVYSQRNDPFILVREHLPEGVKAIGFAGTGNDSEYSFWKPLGYRRVIDMNPISGATPYFHRLDCIVGSELGLNDRYHQSASEFASSIGGTILWEGNVTTFAGREPSSWYVIDAHQIK